MSLRMKMRKARKSISGHESWANDRRTKRLEADSSSEAFRSKDESGLNALPEESDNGLTIFCIQILIKGVIGMAVQDKIMGSANPYAKITVGSVTYKTEIAKRTLNPEWNESFVFYSKDLSKVDIELKHYDTISWNKSVGRVQFDPSVLFDMNMIDEYKTTLPITSGKLKKTIKGTFDVSFRCRKFLISEILEELRETKIELEGCKKELDEEKVHSSQLGCELEEIHEMYQKQLDEKDMKLKAALDKARIFEEQFKSASQNVVELSEMFQGFIESVTVKSDRLGQSLTFMERNVQETREIIGERKDLLGKRSAENIQLSRELTTARHLIGDSMKEIDVINQSLEMKQNELEQVSAELQVTLQNLTDTQTRLTATAESLEQVSAKLRSTQDEYRITRMNLSTEIKGLKSELTESESARLLLQKDLDGIQSFMNDLPSLLQSHLSQ